jgi:hypothetical protein
MPEKERPMPQIIVAKNKHGIVMAAEDGAVQLDEQGNEVFFEVKRIVPISSHCVLLTSGAAEGTDIAAALRSFIQEERLDDVEEVYAAALPFLSTEYERFMTKRCEWQPIDPIHQVSFILAGRTQKDPAIPFRLYFLWTKKRLPMIDGDEISNAFSIPRRMGLEFQLNKMCREGAPLEELFQHIKRTVDRLRTQGEITSPVSFATITAEGYRSLNH